MIKVCHDAIFFSDLQSRNKKLLKFESIKSFFLSFEDVPDNEGNNDMDEHEQLCSIEDYCGASEGP